MGAKKVRYVAAISIVGFGADVCLGPMDTRDGAAALAAAWMESHPVTARSGFQIVQGVKILEVLRGRRCSRG